MLLFFNALYVTLLSYAILCFHLMSHVVVYLSISFINSRPSCGPLRLSLRCWVLVLLGLFWGILPGFICLFCLGYFAFVFLWAFCFNVKALCKPLFERWYEDARITGIIIIVLWIYFLKLKVGQSTPTLLQTFPSGRVLNVLPLKKALRLLIVIQVEL